MKFMFACALFSAVFAFAMADTSTVPNFDAQFKVLADNIEMAAKKFEELSGVKTDFDRQKLLDFLKTTTTKLTEEFKNINDKLMKDSKAVPEELKKKFEELTKQINETVKSLSSPDVQAKAQKLQETLGSSIKQIAQQASELSKSFGLAIPAPIQKTLTEMYDEMTKTTKVLLEKAQKISEGIQEELKKKKN